MIRPRSRSLATLVAVPVLAAASAATAGTEPRIFVFGDSYSDAGNIYAASGGLIPASPPNFEGRFSNGPVWHEVAGSILGWPSALASELGGDVWAWGAAESGDGGLKVPGGVIPFAGTQIDQCLAVSTIDPEDLVILWIGGNDLLGFDPAAEVIAAIDDHVRTLVAAGATRLVVPTVAPLGTLPIALGTPDERPLNDLAAEFNGLLLPLLADLQVELDIEILAFNACALLEDVLADPPAYGLANVTETALRSDGTVVPNPDEYMWWDPFHPTRVTHQIVGERLAAALTLAADLTDDGAVDTRDLLTLLAAWGPCDPGTPCAADVDGSGAVDEADLMALLGEWTR